MARIRTIKPETWKDEALAQLPRDARLLFIGLWNVADDDGLLRCSARLIKAEVFPYDEDLPASRVGELLEMLERGAFLTRYERDGQRYAWIRNFNKHQRIDKPSKTQLPRPTKEEMARRLDDHSENIPGALPEPSRGERNGKEWNGMEGKGILSTSSPGPVVEQQRPLLEIAPSDPPTFVPIAEVFEHWRKMLAHPKAKLVEERRRAVEARLAEGYSVADLKQAIDGCALTPHNQGKNERGEAFDDLELICRNGKQVERFMRNAQAPPRPASQSKAAVRAEDIPKELFAVTGEVQF